MLYHTVLRGEMAHDAGGPYRETFAMYCEELQSPTLRLLVRCPNAVNNVSVAGSSHTAGVDQPRM